MTLHSGVSGNGRNRLLVSTPTCSTWQVRFSGFGWPGHCITKYQIAPLAPNKVLLSVRMQPLKKSGEGA